MPPRLDGARRADALRNEERILAAAHQVFAELGPLAPIDEVAARAGVGKATVYRAFATKQALLAAVARERIEWFARLGEAAIDADDVWEAFRALMLTLAESQARIRLMAPALAAARLVPEVQESRLRSRRALTALMARAQEQGGMRADVEWDDVIVLIAGVTHVLGEREESDPAVWRRYMALVVASLRADGAPVPHDAVDTVSRLDPTDGTPRRA